MSKILCIIFTALFIIFMVGFIAAKCSATDINSDTDIDIGQNPPSVPLISEDNPVVNADFWLQNPPSNSFTNNNLYVYKPDNYGANFGGLPSQNMFMQSNLIKIPQMEKAYNNTNLYYTKDQLNNFIFDYYSIYYVTCSTFFSGSPKIVTVTVSDRLGNTQNLTAYFIPYHSSGYTYNYSQNHSIVYMNEDYSQYITPSSIHYPGFLYIKFPYEKFFTNVYDNKMLTNGFYIENIIFNEDTSMTSSLSMSVFHIADIFSFNQGFSVPPKNNIIATCMNNIGMVNNNYNLSDVRSCFDYFSICAATVGNEDIKVKSTLFNDYSFNDTDGAGYITNEFFCNSGNFTLNYFAIINYNYFKDYYDVDEYIFDKIEVFLNNPNDINSWSSVWIDNSIRDLSFFRVPMLEPNMTTTVKSNFPYFSTFCMFASMPSTIDGSGNTSLTFDNNYSDQFYVEPTSWKDFGAHFNNILVWLAFEIPLLNNLTSPLYLFLNSFSEVWANVLFPVIMALGIFGSVLIAYFVYKFISSLLTK